MDVRLSMFLDWIKPIETRLVFLQSADNDPEFQDVRVYHKGVHELAENTLYLGMREMPPDFAKEDSYFICTQKTAREECNCIIIEEDINELELLDKLRDCLLYYSKWISDMDRALIKGATFQDILDLSEDVFKNPFIILDSHYNFLAGSRKISPRDGKLYEVKNIGHPSPDTLVQLAGGTEDGNGESGLFSCGALYRVAKRFGCEELMADFKNDGFINLCIVVRFSVEPFSPAARGILDIICDRLDVLVKRDDRLMSSSGGIDYFIDQLINGANPEQIANSIGITRMGEYATIQLEASMDEIKTGKIAVINIMNGILPQSRAFCHNEKFYSIVTYSSDKKSQCYYQLQLQRLKSLCSIIKSRCGISNMYIDLADLQYSIVQAESAVRLFNEAREIIPHEEPVEKVEERDPNLCFYKDVMLFHVIERTLGDARRYSFYPENFARMLKDDRQHNTNNCDILAEFLLNGQKYTTAAEKLHMHRNNVLYRLNRMQEKYNISYESREDWLMLTICCLAAKMFPPTFPGD